MSAFSDPVAGRIAKAIAHDDEARVRQLLAAGADLSATGAGGISLLGWALVRLRKRPFIALLDAGAAIDSVDDNGDSVVHYAAIVADHRFLSILLARPIDVDVVNHRSGRTPLMDAVAHQRREQIKMLLAAGADPDLADRAGEAPLHIAAEIDDYGSVLTLLRAGANPYALNRQGATFQRYLAMTPSGLLATSVRSEKDELIAWLHENNIVVDPELSA